MNHGGVTTARQVRAIRAYLPLDFTMSEQDGRAARGESELFVYHAPQD